MKEKSKLWHVNGSTRERPGGASERQSSDKEAEKSSGGVAVARRNGKEAYDQGVESKLT